MTRTIVVFSVAILVVCCGGEELAVVANDYESQELTFTGKDFEQLRNRNGRCFDWTRRYATFDRLPLVPCENVPSESQSGIEVYPALGGYSVMVSRSRAHFQGFVTISTELAIDNPRDVVASVFVNAVGRQPDNEQWTWRGSIKIIGLGGLCMTAASQSAGAAVFLADCNTHGNKRYWILDDYELRPHPSGPIQLAGSNLCLTPSGGVSQSGRSMTVQPCGQYPYDSVQFYDFKFDNLLKDSNGLCVTADGPATPPFSGRTLRLESSCYPQLQNGWVTEGSIMHKQRWDGEVQCLAESQGFAVVKECNFNDQSQYWMF